MATAMPKGTLSRVTRSVALAVSMEAFASLAASWSGPMAKLASLLIEAGGSVSLTRLQTAAPRSSAVLATWRRQGLIRYHSHFQAPKPAERVVLHATLTSGTLEPLTARQAEIVDYLGRAGGTMPLAELAKAMGTSPGTLKTLAKRGAIAIHPQAVRRTAVGVASGGPAPTLTPHQAEVLEAIESAPAPTTFLLHGVTGSGKTEVYLRAIADVLDRGGGAIVLVPEIALTPQTVRRFQARFGDTVAVLHSNLSDGERYDEWQRIRSGAARVVVGARSAIFAPVEALGLIIIDEEHEGSYKQDKQPRYHARAVAEARARLEGCSLILGSATPSLESYVAALSGRYSLLEMPDRVASRPLPPVAVVDMRAELKEGNRHPFSRQLARALGGALERGEQAILLMNRRGYSSFVFCRNCGFVCKCQRCAVAMTYHQSPPRLQCHYCDARAGVPDTCPACKSPYIRHFGAGTQQIEEAAAKLFPQARIVRLDRDTTSRKGAHQHYLDAFGRGEYDVLIGTQMVAKGLDFPRVTVVGVMAADGALHLPDFRAAEHTFQLLTQVAGRAGRGELPSQVVVQTYSPTHPAIVAAQAHDFQAFFHYDAPNREELRYPPFVHLANLVVAGPHLDDTHKAADDLAEELSHHDTLEVLGPIPAPLAMLRGMHRFQVLVKARDLTEVRGPIQHAVAVSMRPGVRVAVDLDPVNML
jgi:primosomal protein N' (replication factor Y)